MRRRSLCFVLAASATSLFLTSCGGGLGVGDDVPDIEAAGWLNGAAPKESDLRGKVVVIEAWGTS